MRFSDRLFGDKIFEMQLNASCLAKGQKIHQIDKVLQNIL
jgi:hypothetical protein